MWNTITGTKNGRRTVINYYLWDEADKNNGISAMARVTGYSAAVGALFLGRGMLTQKGIVPPEDGIQGEIYSLFMDELSRRAIRVINQIDVYESDGNTSSM
jgi:lysine 6-dehydrogenase